MHSQGLTAWTPTLRSMPVWDHHRVPPIQEPPRPSTSQDVARRAGVSRSTVSNILNGNGDRFPLATRERVLTAAAELNYQPSLAGRTLASGRSDTVVLLVPNTTFGSNLQSAVDQVVESTRQIGGNVVVRFASNTPDATVAAISALRPLAVVDFGVLSKDDLTKIEQWGAIVVPSLVRQRTPTLDGGIGRLQAEALLESGHRRLWFAALSDERTDPYGPPRLATLTEFCSSHGLAEPQRVSVPLTLPGATAALATILDDGPSAGVACYNDDVALALLAAARETGVAVPSTLAVVGVDHTRIGQLWAPPLTTIDTNLPAIITTLASELRARLEGQPPNALSATPPQFTLIRGGTT